MTATDVSGTLADHIGHRMEFVIGAAGRGIQLRVTDGDLLGRLSKDRLSASTSKAMQSCSARWVAEKALPEHPDPFSPAEIGTGVHTVAERLYLMPQPERTYERALLIARELTSDMFPTPDWVAADGGEKLQATRIHWMSEVIDHLKGLWEVEDPRHVNTKAVELRVDDVDVAGVPFIGFIDRLDKVDRDGKVVSRCVDLKSGRVPKNIVQYGDDHGDQMRLYKAALEAKYGASSDEFWLHYTKHGKKKKVATSKQRMAETLATFEQSWGLLQERSSTGLYPTRTSGLCGWCPLVNACPSAAAEGKVAKIPAASPQELGMDRSVVLGMPAMPGRAEPETGGSGTQGTCSALESEDTQGTIDDEEIPLSTITFIEDKSWVNYDDRGTPNANGYATQASFGITGLAVETLDDLGYPLTPATVTALARTFAAVVREGQKQITGGRTGLGDGANARMRHALHVVMRTLKFPMKPVTDADPDPVKPTVAEWQAWMESATRRSVSIAKVSWMLVNDVEPDPQPYLALASDEGAPVLADTPVEQASPVAGEDAGFSGDVNYDYVPDPV